MNECLEKIIEYTPRTQDEPHTLPMMALPLYDAIDRYLRDTLVFYTGKPLYFSVTPKSFKIFKSEGGSPLLRVDRFAHHRMPDNHLQYGHEFYTDRHGDEACDILAEVLKNNSDIEFMKKNDKDKNNKG